MMKHSFGCSFVIFLVLASFMSTNASAQARRMLLSGEIVSPAYEGWWPNEDGTYKLFFGYMNSNWEQQFDIPVGPENYFSVVDEAELDDLRSTITLKTQVIEREAEHKQEM